MSARQKDASEEVIRPSAPAGGSLASLTRTLEDLEARLGRLAHAKGSTPEPVHVDETLPKSEPITTTARLRAVIEQRLAQRAELDAAASRLAMDAADGAGRAEGEIARRRSMASALDRRFGTIAGEVESLQMQGATFQLVSGVADDLQALKAEIADNIAARSESEFAGIRSAFDELRSALAAREGADALGGHVSMILDRLSQMQAEGVDRASVEAIRVELDDVSGRIASMARDDTATAVNARWDAFEARLSEHVELDREAKLDLRAELERLRETVRGLASEEQVRAVESRWDDFEARYFDTVRSETEGQFDRLLRGEIDAIRARLDALSNHAVDTREEDRTATAENTRALAALQEGVHRLALRLDELEEALVGLPTMLGVERIEDRLHALGESVAILAARQDEPDLEHFLILEERLDEIAQAIVATSVRDEAAFDMAPVERIEARVADLAARIEHLAARGDADILSARVAELSERIEFLATRPSEAALEDRLEAFSQRLDAALAAVEEPRPEMAEFERRLTELAERLEGAASTRLDDGMVAGLEVQIARLSEQLSRAVVASGATLDEETGRRLAAIEEKLEEGRADVMAAARAAADEAVRLVLADGRGRESEHVRDLSEDLQRLEALSRQSDDRSLKVFEAVHATLLKIVERLTVIEGEVAKDGERPARQASPFAASLLAAMPVPEPMAERAPPEMASSDAEPAHEPRGLRASLLRRFSRSSAEPRAERGAAAALADAVAGRDEWDDRYSETIALAPDTRTRIDEAPSLDASDSLVAREFNRPLEPGSGAPDIASLLERVRRQREELDTIAPANDRGARTEPAVKADLIAAARKAALAAAAEAETLRAEAANDGAESSSDEPGATGRRHRKPILMAVGAVLLALMAIPLGRAYLDREPAGEEAIAGLDRPVAEESAATAPDVQTGNAAMEPAGAEPQVAAVEPPAAAPRMSAPETAAPITAIPAEEPVVAQAPAASEAAVETAIAGPAPTPAAPPAPVVAERAAIPEAAIATLPEAARGALPTAPSGIGSTELVAAADNGDPRAIFEIGLRLVEGRTGAPDPAQALVWFAHAANLGYAPAQYSLGTLFEKGNGVERNGAAAREWYELAAGQGNVRAMHNLAVLYATGIDGQAEPETAARWFTEAAEHGMRDSQYNLGILHARGAGVEQDLGQSYKWFRIVGNSGDRDAVAKGEEVARTLSADQRASLDEEVAAWQPQARNEAANSVEIPPEWQSPPEQTASVDMRRAVRNVQAILGNLGFDAGTPDGVVGDRTTAAIRAFQEQNGLAVTGEIDETLIRELLKRNV
ncbi:peptidoglycan-binding protein [Aureimonas mangrovi]|uniref:peptidoglycan-binding protein n=1 Tax=Aureimonas mangrovi TaxID=2758041 RepID=UPI00163D482A|nr:peptidoglycan-binding protein [Aureimonas mangrovi]